MMMYDYGYGYKNDDDYEDDVHYDYKDEESYTNMDRKYKILNII